MDALEQMALDLEAAQNKRYRKARAHTNVEKDRAFWSNPTEFSIFETIKLFRNKSRTYTPPPKKR